VENRKVVVVSRRKFLKAGLFTVAAAGAVVCGVDTLLHEAGRKKVEFSFHTYGDENMTKKSLIAYASRTGSTAGVADAVGRTIAQRGLRVDVRPMHEVESVEPYAAVVAGSAIQGGWLPEAMKFLRDHQGELARRPFAAFLTCITLAMRGGESYRVDLGKHMQGVRALLRPVSEGYFAGALDLSALPLVDSWKMRIPVALGIFPEGDHRDWEKIRAWAEDLGAQWV
jgi:menaquinone-dependent protoporphyrinogen oxidase